MDITLRDVKEVYEGVGGFLWEMLMGEQIHVGGEAETDIMAQKAQVNKETIVLDICSGLGGPARHLASKYGCSVRGLDATQKMLYEAMKRTKDEMLDHLVQYQFGNAMDIPFRSGSFDVVWGQDGWCYITNKNRLIDEAHRVLKPGGVITFTDWIQTGNMTDEEWVQLNRFATFPYMETLDGYEKLLLNSGFDIMDREDLSVDFKRHCTIYQQKLRNDLKDSIIQTYGTNIFSEIDTGLIFWVNAAHDGKVGRGKLVGKKL